MILSLLVFLLLLWIFYDRFIDGRKLPPGPVRLPILGNLLQMGVKKSKNPAPHEMLKAFCKEYGPIMTLQFGMKRQVIIEDCEIIRKIYQSDLWLNRPTDKWLLERSNGKELGILFCNGDLWRDTRRFSIRTLRDFGFGKQKGQEAIMQEEIDELMRRLDERISQEGSTIKINHLFTASVLNILWSMMAGTRFSHDDAKLQKMVTNSFEALRLINAAGNILMAFPPLRTILGKLTGMGEQRKKLSAETRQVFQDILDERRSLGYYKDDQRDFIDVYLSEIDKHKGSTSANNVFTDEQFVTVGADLFGAGNETTSNSLEFCMLYMLLNPDVQDKVYQEIEREVGIEFPTLTMKPKMPYTEATLLEIQRLASVAPMVVRSPSTDFKIGKYEIKKGTFTILNLYAAHMNPDVWSEPEKFRPERFLGDHMEIINVDKMFPFGEGLRRCMGDQLAKATMFTYFVRFLQNYRVERSLDHELPSTESVPGLTLAPKPFHAVIKKRKF